MLIFVILIKIKKLNYIIWEKYWKFIIKNEKKLSLKNLETLEENNNDPRKSSI